MIIFIILYLIQAIGLILLCKYSKKVRPRKENDLDTYIFCSLAPILQTILIFSIVVAVSIRLIQKFIKE